MLLKSNDNGYASLEQNLQHAWQLAALREEIENARTAIPLDTLANVAQAAVCRINKCLEANGHHFEHLL